MFDRLTNNIEWINKNKGMLTLGDLADLTDALRKLEEVTARVVSDHRMDSLARFVAESVAEMVSNAKECGKDDECNTQL